MGQRQLPYGGGNRPFRESSVNLLPLVIGEWDFQNVLTAGSHTKGDVL